MPFKQYGPYGNVAPLKRLPKARGRGRRRSGARADGGQRHGAGSAGGEAEGRGGEPRGGRPVGPAPRGSLGPPVPITTTTMHNFPPSLNLRVYIMLRISRSQNSFPGAVWGVDLHSRPGKHLMTHASHIVGPIDRAHCLTRLPVSLCLTAGCHCPVHRRPDGLHPRLPEGPCPRALCTARVQHRWL